MNGMEKIQAKIAEESKAEISAIEKNTKEQVDAIKAKGEADAAALKAELLARGEKQVAERRERLASSAEMECRKMELAMKQEVISMAFDKALEGLCSLTMDEYVDLMASLALASVSSGKESIVFNPKDKEALGKKVVAKVNEAIAAGKAPELPGSITDSKAGAFLEKMVKAVTAVVKSGNVTVAEETRPLAGGFIMLDGDVEINNDFDTLVRLQRNSLELEVAAMLF